MDRHPQSFAGSCRHLENLNVTGSHHDTRSNVSIDIYRLASLHIESDYHSVHTILQVFNYVIQFPTLNVSNTECSKVCETTTCA